MKPLIKYIKKVLHYSTDGNMLNQGFLSQSASEDELDSSYDFDNNDSRDINELSIMSGIVDADIRVGSKKSTAKKSTFPNRRFFDYRFFAPRVFISIFCQYGLYVGFMVLMVSNVDYLS